MAVYKRSLYARKLLSVTFYSEETLPWICNLIYVLEIEIILLIAKHRKRERKAGIIFDFVLLPFQLRYLIA